MPSVFLSYSRSDVTTVRQLEQGLAANGVSVWRDQEKIYGGQKWPKILGEEIANQDVFLLAWSKNSAESYYVEFEWCTALALKKTIIPCLLDDTPLPASLKTFHGSDARQLSQAVEQILGWLRVPQPAHPERTAKVLGKLDDIDDTEPQKVLRAAKAIFDQRNWVVQNVIQGENVTVTIGKSSEEAPKGVLEKWQTWVKLAVGLLTAVTLALGLLDKLPWSIFPDQEGKVFDQPMAGQILDAATGEPLAGVRIAVLGFTMDPQTTNQDGHFHFDKVRGTRQERVKFTAGKDCYKVETIEANLGNTDLRPALEKLDLERCK